MKATFQRGERVLVAEKRSVFSGRRGTVGGSGTLFCNVLLDGDSLSTLFANGELRLLDDDEGWRENYASHNIAANQG